MRYYSGHMYSENLRFCVKQESCETNFTAQYYRNVRPPENWGMRSGGSDPLWLSTIYKELHKSTM